MELHWVLIGSRPVCLRRSMEHGFRITYDTYYTWRGLGPTLIYQITPSDWKGRTSRPKSRLGTFRKYQCLGLIPRDSDSTSLEWGLGINIPFSLPRWFNGTGFRKLFACLPSSAGNSDTQQCLKITAYEWRFCLFIFEINRVTSTKPIFTKRKLFR